MITSWDAEENKHKLTLGETLHTRLKAEPDQRTTLCVQYKTWNNYSRYINLDTGSAQAVKHPIYHISHAHQDLS